MPSPEQMTAATLRSVPERTGKTVEEWVELIRDSGITDAKARRAWLKTEHGLKQNTQWALVRATEQAEGKTEPTAAELLAAQYSGAKGDLRPIYDRLEEIAIALGGDVELATRKTYVALARGYQFAIVQPTTRTRVDLGLRLPDVAASGRLEDAGSFGSGSVTHRVRLGAVDEVDDEVAGWLAQAYAARGS